MGFLNNTKEKLEATGEQIKTGFHETVDRADDKADELKANAEVKKAEKERDSVENRNDYKEELRQT